MTKLSVICGLVLMLVRFADGICLGQVSVPVEGDSALLIQVSKSLREHHKQLNEGYWKGSFDDGFAKAIVRYGWDGENARIEFKITRNSLADVMQSGFAVVNENGKGIFFEKSNTAVFTEGHKRGLQPGLDCHPAKVWYDYRGVFWPELLTHDPVRGAVKKFEVLDGDGLVTVRRHYQNDSHLEIVVSKELGMNIVSYKMKNVAGGETVSEGEATWKKTSDGRFYPARMRHWRYAQGGERGKPKVELNIYEFATTWEKKAAFDFRPEVFDEGTTYIKRDSIGKEIFRIVVGDK